MACCDRIPGEIHLFGEEISHAREEALFPLRTRTGMVFQEGALFDSLTVRDNVAYQLIQERVPDDEIDTRVREALRFVGLEQTFSLYPGSLSGGMRRRVAIARALIHAPHLLLYDSPTGGLDPVTSTTIIELIVKQRDVYKTPSVLVTHRLQDAFTMCTHRFDTTEDRMVPLPKGVTDPNTTFLMLAEGRLIFDGSLHELVAARIPSCASFWSDFSPPAFWDQSAPASQCIYTIKYRLAPLHSGPSLKDRRIRRRG